LYLSVGLSVALCVAIALFGLHLENADFLKLAILDDACGNARARKNGGTKRAAVIVDNRQNAVKGHSFACLGVQLLDEENIALGNAVLLSTCFDDCVLHTHCTCLSRSLALGAETEVSL